MPVQAQFVDTVAILVDDLHLLYNRRLAALTGTFAQGVLVGCGNIKLRGVIDIPSSRILHSRRSFFESSSSPRSMA